MFLNLLSQICNMVYIEPDMLNNILSIFLHYYMVNYIDDTPSIDKYSDLDPSSDSKHILDALHNILKDLNLYLRNYSPQGGPDPDPDFGPYIYLLIKTVMGSYTLIRNSDWNEE